ncbi:hypothetical protein [Streptomyces sp. NPDC005438]|uniref:hypothetical protein n=1 Tax=Streptomyces sp. NPDC005438 TaxID=3156880 RepID=UPI0033A3B962
MAGFLDRAKEQAQRGLSQGKEKLSDVQQQRAGQELVRKLGVAYYAQQKGTGSAQDVQQALKAVEDHVAEHGDSSLKGGGKMF